MTMNEKDDALLRFILQYKAAYGGTSPTVRQIKDALGISSTSVVAYRLDRLVRLGALKRYGRGYGLPGEQYTIERSITLPARAMLDLLRIASEAELQESDTITIRGDAIDMLRGLIAHNPEPEVERWGMLQLKPPEESKEAQA